MLYFITMIGSFLTVIFLTLLIYNTIFASRLAVLNRLETHTLDANTMQEVEAARGKGFKADFYKVLGVLGKIFPRKSYLESMQKKLIKAHVLMRAQEFVGLSVFTGIGVLLLLYLLTGTLLLAVPAGILGFKMPDVVVNMKKKKRAETLGNQLPEALNIISGGLRAGFSFPQAMGVVGKEMEPPISEEFNRVIRENRFGKPMEEALLNLSERTDNDDLDMFVTALIIQRQVGGNLAEVLDNISHTIRERVRIKGEIKTLTAQGKISAVIVCLLPVGVAAFITVANPGYMVTLIEDPIGLIVLVMAVMLQIIGIYFISKIVNIEV